MRRRLEAVPVAFVIAVLFSFFGLSATALADAPPAVTIDPPTDVSYQTAHVSGTVDPEGGPSTTFWRFEYSTEPDNPESWIWSSAFGEISGTEAEGTNPIPVEGTLEFLQPGTEYSVRLVAENGEGANRVQTGPPYSTFTTVYAQPPVLTLYPPTAITDSSARFEADLEVGGTDPVFNTSWWFECIPSCGFYSGSVPGDGANHHISVDATELTPGTHYEVTFYAASTAGGFQQTAPQSFTTSTLPPQLEHVAAHPLTTEAELQGRISPGGLETSYHFEYGPTSSYGQTTPVQTLPAGAGSTKVAAKIAGLSPSTTYHFRLVAENADGQVESGDRTFSTRAIPGEGPPDSCPNAAIRQAQGSSYLPDCRAYEMVSPLAKNLGQIVRVNRASDQGDTIALTASAGVPGSNGIRGLSVMVADREADGWHLRPAGSPGEPPLLGAAVLDNPVDFDPSFEKLFLETPGRLVPEDTNHGEGADLYDLYEIQVGSGSATWLSQPQGGSGYLPGTSGVAYGASSVDHSRVFFTILNNEMLSGGPSDGLYERQAGSLRLVSVLPDGTPAGTGYVASPASSRSGFDGAPFGGGMGVPHGGGHAVSDDGSSVYWIPFPTNQREIYLSRDGQPTVEITADAPSPFNRFIAATHDGGVAYFVNVDGHDLYRYDAETEDITMLTPPVSSGALVRSAILSDDGSHLYFVANSALTPDAKEDSLNFYVWSEGAGVRLVANGGFTDKTYNIPDHFARVSTNGRYALIESEFSLHGANTDGHMGLYAYDDATGNLDCVSCRPDGSASEANASAGEIGETVPPATANVVTQKLRNLATDGRVFFMSRDQLLPQDINDVMDAYEWSGGQLSLISSGRSDFPSYLGDNGDDGADVFLLTRSQLDPRDTDGSYDAYDVRAGGGFAYSNPKAGLACEEEDCQGASVAPPAPPAVGSTSLRGRGKAKKKSRQAILGLRGLDASGRAALARGDKATLGVRVRGRGRVILVGRSHIGKKSRNVLRAAAKPTKAGRAPLRFRISPRGLAALRARGVLRVRMTVRFGTALPRKLALTLRAAAGASGGSR